MKTITALQLSAWLEEKKEEGSPPILLDVREKWELAICAIPGAVHIPLRSVEMLYSVLPSDQPIVVICHHGGRSAQAGNFLHQKGFPDVYNLQGGIAAWSKEVDSAMPAY